MVSAGAPAAQQRAPAAVAQQVQQPVATPAERVGPRWEEALWVQEAPPLPVSFLGQQERFAPVPPTELPPQQERRAVRRVHLRLRPAQVRQKERKQQAP